MKTKRTAIIVSTAFCLITTLFYLGSSAEGRPDKQTQASNSPDTICSSVPSSALNRIILCALWNRENESPFRKPTRKADVYTEKLGVGNNQTLPVMEVVSKSGRGTSFFLTSLSRNANLTYKCGNNLKVIASPAGTKLAHFVINCSQNLTMRIEPQVGGDNYGGVWIRKMH